MTNALSTGILVLFLLLPLLGMAAIVRAADFPAFEQLPAVEEFPDPLKMLDGTTVATDDDWNAKRKPELKALFQHYMYGQLPTAPPIIATVRSEYKDCLGGKATMKQVLITFGPADCPAIDLLLIVPNRPAGKTTSEKAPPVILGLNFTGNHTVLEDPRIEMTAQLDARRGRHRAASGHRGESRQGGRSMGDRTVDRSGLRGGDVLLRRRRSRSGRAGRRHSSLLLQRRGQLGRHRRLGLGRASSRRLSGDRQGNRRQADRGLRPLAQRQGGPRGGGFR